MPISRKRLAVIAVACALLALASVSAFSADQASGVNIVPNLEAVCNAGIVQAALVSVSPAVNVKEIADGPKFPDGTHFVAGAKGVPAYCQVTGSFVTNDKTGKTANFLATLPTSWNGKYLQLGCAGDCGRISEVNDAAQSHIVITSEGYEDESIIKGYASFSTDEGHVGADFDWAVNAPGKLNEDAMEDFYYRADQMLAKMGKQFTVNFYGRAIGSPQQISRSYFVGCSGGGRDALVAASHFPEEFDGIVAGCPYANVMGYSAFNIGLSMAQLRAEVPPMLINLIDPIVKAKCDKLDGVEDGLIQNPAACDFRAERDLPLCDGKRPRTACFTKEQTETVSAYLSAVTDESGHIFQTGHSISEIKLPNQPREMSDFHLNNNLRYFVFDNVSDFDFRNTTGITLQSGGSGQVTGFHIVIPKAVAGRATDRGRMGIGSIPENAAKLIGLNHKLLMWHSLGDGTLTPYISINYYKELSAMYGGYQKLQENIRLFLLPDVGHCGNGSTPGPNNFDAITAIEDWVENGHAPESLIATLYDMDNNPPLSRKPLRTMPACKFPEMAHYSGSGDINDAVNWTCPANDTSMLKVGESGREAGVE